MLQLHTNTFLDQVFDKERFVILNRLRLLFIEIFYEENLPSERYFTGIHDGLKLRGLAWRKIVNPFNTLEFLLGLLFHSLSALFLTLLALVLLPSRSLTYLISFAGERAGKKAYTVLVALPANLLSYLFYSVLMTAMFLTNCVLSPVSTLVVPLKNCIYDTPWPAWRLALLVILAALVAVPLIALVVFCTGTPIPHTLAFLQPVVNFMTPAFTFLNTHLNPLMIEALVSLPITLISSAASQRTVGGTLFDSWIRLPFWGDNGTMTHAEQACVDEAEANNTWKAKLREAVTNTSGTVGNIWGATKFINKLSRTIFGLGVPKILVSLTEIATKSTIDAVLPESPVNNAFSRLLHDAPQNSEVIEPEQQTFPDALLFGGKKTLGWHPTQNHAQGNDQSFTQQITNWFMGAI